MSGLELAVLACRPAGEPKAKSWSQASNVLQRQHHRSTSHPTQAIKTQEAPDCSKESAIWSVVTNPAEIKKDDEFMNVCVCNISTDADRIDVPLAEIASISSKQTSRELPPLWYSLKMQNEKKILHFECFWNHLKRTDITCRDHKSGFTSRLVKMGEGR